MSDMSTSQRVRLLGAVLLFTAAVAAAYFGAPPRGTDSDKTAEKSQGSPTETDKSDSGRAGADKNAPADLSRGKDKPGSRSDNPNSPPESGDRKTDPSGKTRPAPIAVENVTVKDLDGKVAFKGTVQLQPTLDRIAAGKKLRFSRDGSTFENREGRLPKKPAGYYTEWIHLTPKVDGPGPQRVVTGKGGEVYYTWDHYRTFKQLRQGTFDKTSPIEKGPNPNTPAEGRQEKSSPMRP